MKPLIYQIGENINGSVYLGEAGFFEGKCQRHRLCKFLCQYCNSEFIAKVALIRSGDTKSCGCIKSKNIREAQITHNMSKSSEYNAWKGIRRRCYNKNCIEYKNYGNRGIKMSDEWKNSFETFLKDMGHKPFSEYSIDRIDNDGNYCKENCKWSNRADQNSNTRRTVYVTYNGQRRKLIDIVKEHGVDRGVVGARLYSGWPIEKALENSIR